MKKTIVPILFVASLFLAAYTIKVILIGFAGVLLGILLSTASNWIQLKTGVPRGWCLLVVVTAIVAIVAANIWLFGLNVATQIDELSTAVREGRDSVETYLQKYEWGRRLISEGTDGNRMVSRATSAVSNTVHFIAALILIICVALYTASNPTIYVNGFIKLLPQNRRSQAATALNAAGNALRWWLLGQVISMTVVGFLTTLGLWILDVPLPVTLGFLTAILNFIPNFGAILAAGLAAALALTRGPETALYTLILFVFIQGFEAYVLTPLIQQRAVSLPPALTITVQALLGVAVGAVGIALAAPVTVVGLVLVKRLRFSERIPASGGNPRPPGNLHSWPT